MYNLICFGSFILTLTLSFLLEKMAKKELILRIISTILFVYKSLYYITENIRGNVSIPVEISSISYFLSFIIFVFKIKKLYCVGAFFGIIAGLGYFAFYTFFGFTVESAFTVKNILVGCFSHGYLFVSGVYLFKNYKFEKNGELLIWLTLLAMLCWALVFYDVEMRGVTFIYFIIKPEFIFIFNNVSLNILLMIFYYIVLVFAFFYIVKLFFKLNDKRSKKL